MNASMNDSHNLGKLHTLVSTLCRAFILHVLISVEDGICSPRMGGYLTSQNSKSQVRRLAILA